MSTIGQSATDEIARTLLPIIAVSTLGASALQLGVLQALGMLTIWQLLIIAALISVADVLFSTASGVALPRVVAAADLDSAYGSLAAAEKATAIVAPGLGALVTRLLSAPLAVGVGALGFLTSAVGLATLRIPAADSAPQGAHGWFREAAEGLSFAAGHAVLRPLMLVALLWNAESSFVNAVLVLFALRDAGVTSSQFAAIAMIEAVAALLASLMARRIATRLGIGRTKVITAICQAAALAVYPCVELLPGPALLWFAVAGTFAAFVGVINSLAGAGTVARVTPDHMLARVMSCSRLASLGVIPIASIAAGALAQLFGAVPVLWGAVGLVLASLAVFWLSPMRRWQTFPAELAAQAA